MIKDIVSNYVELKKNGNNYVGLCPFHSDTKPSLIVNENKNIYKCFACGAGGNALGFISNFEKCSINEAKVKANEILQSDVYQINKSNDIDAAKQKLLKIYVDVAHLFLTSSQYGKEQLQYLLDRGISLETIEKNKIGFCPYNNDNIFLEVIKQQLNGDNLLKEMLDIHLLNLNNNCEYINAFNNRLIFPIFDSRNNIIGITGRAILNEQDIKYLNLANFEKQNYLYGINFINNNTQHIFITEGIFDCLSLQQLGYDAVCTMGADISKEQINQLHYFKNIKTLSIAFDNDIIGYNKSLEVFKKLRQSNKYWAVSFVDWYDIQIKDLNDVLITGEENLKELANNCIDLNLFKTNHYIEHLNPNQTNSWILINNDVNIKDSIFKNIICKRLTENNFNDLADFYQEIDKKQLNYLNKQEFSHQKNMQNK